MNSQPERAQSGVETGDGACISRSYEVDSDDGLDRLERAGEP
jgi:hypothetical protein